MIFRNKTYDLMFNTQISGRTWQIQISIDGQAYYNSSSSTIDDHGNGSYIIHFSENDMDGNIINCLLTETNQIQFDPEEKIKYEIVIVTDDPITIEAATYLNSLSSDMTDIKAQFYHGSGSIIWTYIVYTDSYLNNPLEGCLVGMSTDISGGNLLNEQLTDASGITRWLVNPGSTYYMWRKKSGWRFSNPDIQVTDAVAPLSTDLAPKHYVIKTYALSE